MYALNGFGSLGGILFHVISHVSFTHSSESSVLDCGAESAFAGRSFEAAAEKLSALPFMVLSGILSVEIPE